MSNRLYDLIEELNLKRQELGISLEKLGQKVGYSRYTLMKWEGHHRRPRADRLLDWAQGLGYRLTWERINDEEERE